MIELEEEIKMHIKFFACIHLSAYLSVEGFVLKRQSIPNTITYRIFNCAPLYSSKTSSEQSDNVKYTPTKHSGLQFKASMVYQSDQVPFEHCKEVTRFFDTTEPHFHLLAKGTRNIVEEIDKCTVTSYLSHWRAEALHTKARNPTSSDKLLSVSVNTLFLVFVLRVKAIIGVKLLWHLYDVPNTGNESILLPEYQFSLLDQKFTADGPPPLVFIFNQLTGIDKTIKGTYTQPNHALYTVITKPSRDFKSISFDSRLTAELNIRFPEILLKLLPVPKEKIEKEGSISLKRNMERDVPSGVDLFTNAYIDWLGEMRRE